MITPNKIIVYLNTAWLAKIKICTPYIFLEISLNNKHTNIYTKTNKNYNLNN
jgi:hypothetical protein